MAIRPVFFEMCIRDSHLRSATATVPPSQDCGLRRVRGGRASRRNQPPQLRTSPCSRSTAVSYTHLAVLVTMVVGLGWMMEGVMALVESWHMPCLLYTSIFGELMMPSFRKTCFEASFASKTCFHFRHPCLLYTSFHNIPALLGRVTSLHRR